MQGIKWLGLVIAVFIIIVILWFGFKNITSLQPTTNPTPTSAVIPTPTISPSPTLGLNCQAINIITPKPNDSVSSPLNIRVIIDNSKANCPWTVFEAQAGAILLKDSNETVLGTGILKTTQDWTASTPVTYTGQVTFIKSDENNLTLIINEENPSGKPNAQSISIPLIQK